MDDALAASAPGHGGLIVPKGEGLRITGTFLDEISHDIPHQNWGEKEWDADFRHMKSIGIDTVIGIRSGYRKFITYPSPYLLKKGCYMPSVDLLDLFLRLAGKYGMKFYFGLYDSGEYWDTGDMSHEVEHNKYVIDEVWNMYGRKYESFGGWYLSGEISRATKGAIGTFHALGKQCKEVSGRAAHLHLAVDRRQEGGDGQREQTDQGAGCFRRAARTRMGRDIRRDSRCGGCLCVSGRAYRLRRAGCVLCGQQTPGRQVRHAMLDQRRVVRPRHAIKFLPIKFDKLRMKLEAAMRAGYDKAITFEFSHFMSPQSAYLQAGHLFDRYKEYFNIR